MSLGILAKKAAKLALDQATGARVALLRRLGLIDFPVPSYTQMLGIGSHSIRHYYESGIACALPIAVAALQAGLDLESRLQILDFGCGAGRQLLHLTRRFPKPSYHACDVNLPAARFVARHYPQVDVRHTGFQPPLPFAAGAFDMVYSVSVFSHLGPEDQRLWLAELARITRPDGCCLLTTEGFKSLGALAAPPLPPALAARRAALAAAGLIFQDYADLPAHKASERRVRFGSKYLGIEGRYGTTLLAPDYIRAHWPGFGFTVETIIEGIIDYQQDLVVLRRT